MEWVKNGYRRESLIGDDGEILQTIEIGSTDNSVFVYPLGKPYYGIEAAKAAAEKAAQLERRRKKK